VEVTFEPRVPVVGQILILEAFDFVYNLTALGETPVLAPPAPSLGDLAVSAPGKLLAQQNNLTVEYVRNGSVKEILSGLPAALDKVLALLKWFVINIQLKGAPARIEFVRNELAPAIAALKQQGLSDRGAEHLIKKAATYLDDVLAKLITQKKLSIDPVSKFAAGKSPCPTCMGVGLV
jgi:hypothetical protein